MYVPLGEKVKISLIKLFFKLAVHVYTHMYQFVGQSLSEIDVRVLNNIWYIYVPEHVEALVSSTCKYAIVFQTINHIYDITENTYRFIAGTIENFSNK